MRPKFPVYLDPPDDLTPQEVRVLLLKATGKTTREIASSLFNSPRTIENHISRIKAKTGVTTDAGMVWYSIERGLVDPAKRAAGGTGYRLSL